VPHAKTFEEFDATKIGEGAPSGKRFGTTTGPMSEQGFFRIPPGVRFVGLKIIRSMRNMLH
jgi:hypothetical protein